MMQPTKDTDPPAQSPGFDRLRRLGVMSWSAVGIIALVVIIAGGVSALSGILVPLIVAIILGTLLEPLVTLLQKIRVPRTLAATVVLLVAIAIAGAVAALLVWGFGQQMPEIAKRLWSGWQYLQEWVRSFDLDQRWFDYVRLVLTDYVPQIGNGALGIVTNTVFGAVSFAIGSFFALYFLFFVLRDGKLFPAWFARVSSQDQELLVQIDARVKESLHGYFRGTAVTALITAPVFVIPLLLLGIPLVIPILILYFFLSFVPYVGAWITGAFAVLIAFGFGGGSAALIVSLSLLISNGTLQSAVSSWALGSSLKLHPVAVLLSTLIGGVIAGILGMVLGPPLLSAVQKTISTVRNYRAPGESGEIRTEPTPPILE